jgi:6-phosphogluconolactonase
MQFNHIEAESNEDFFVQGTTLMAEILKKHIAQNGQVILGLSGGSTPGAIYEALGRQSDVDWSKVTLFLVDDRFVLASFPESNQRLVEDTLLRHANIPEDRIFFPDPRLPIEEFADDYDEHIEVLMAEDIPYVITLGLGLDGHIASLFPPVSDEAFGEGFAIHSECPRKANGQCMFPVCERVSTTMRVLTGADDKIVFLNGFKKRRLWKEMMDSDEGEVRWPLKSVIASGGTTVLSYWQ